MQNFGKIKSKANEIISEGISEKKTKNLNIFKKYVKLLKENKILKTQFLVISNIENKVETNREKASQFVKENIDLLLHFNKKELLESNNKLNNLLLEFSDDILSDNYELKDLHENITTLITTPRKPNTIEVIIEATNKVIDHIVSNEPKVITEDLGLPMSMVTQIMVDKYNEAYSDLDENTKKIIRVMIESSQEEKEELYSSLTTECLELLNNKLKEPNLDIEIKEGILNVKEKLLNDKKDINENFNDKMCRLGELYNNLKND